MDISYMFMVPVLEFLHKTLGSYGWAIIGLTLLVRVCVWPFVAASTKSMQAMAKVQPKLKVLQEKYKDQPEVLQKKMAEFYMKNKVNPFGGCLPMLIQLPVLFALFGTFTGPPFQDKAIPVKVKLSDPKSADKTTVSLSPTSSADSTYVGTDGKICKFVVHPGDSTLIFGRMEGQPTADGFNTLDFTVSTSHGDMPAGFKPKWKIATDPLKAMIQPNGQVVFPSEGEITLAAIIPASYTGGGEPKEIPVKVKVLKKEGDGGGFPIPGGGGSNEDAIKEKKEASNTSVEATVDGKPVKLDVEPGDMTITAGKTASFRLHAASGVIPENFPVEWKVTDDPNGSSITDDGKAVFKHAGEVIVNAMIPGEAKNEPFLFMNSIGKVAKGMDLLKPQNFDVLSLILLFGFTMWLSQKLMVTTPSADPEQAAVQKQTQQIMPFTVTAMFFFMPLPAGVYLYMVFSNMIQSLQTWLIMKSPAPDVPDIDDDDDDNSTGEKKTVIEVLPNDKKGKKAKDSKGSASNAGASVIDLVPNDKKGKKNQGSEDSDENSAKMMITDKETEGNN